MSEHDVILIIGAGGTLLVPRESFMSEFVPAVLAGQPIPEKYEAKQGPCEVPLRIVEIYEYTSLLFKLSQAQEQEQEQELLVSDIRITDEDRARCACYYQAPVTDDPCDPCDPDHL